MKRARSRCTGIEFQAEQPRAAKICRWGPPGAFFLLLFVFSSFLFANPSPAHSKISSEAAKQLKEADRSRHSLEDSEKRKKYRHNWMRCIRRYKEIYTRYPKSNEAAWALYQAGRLYRGLYRYSRTPSDLDEAVALFKRLTEEFETHRLADDAQYLIGEIHYDEKKDPTQAYVEFLKVDIKFPEGDMRPRARKRLDELAVILSKRGAEEKRKEEGKSSSGLTPVKEIRHWSTPNYTRVVIDLDGEVKYTHHLLRADPDIHKPRRLYLDLKNALVSSEIDSAIPIKDGLLHRARAGQYTKDTVRVVLDIESLGGYKVFHLFDPFRIVVDVKRRDDQGGEEATQTASSRQVRRGIRKGKPDHTVSLARQLGLSVKTIVIDPGHGGKDPGCILRNGTKEKDIVLEMARNLASRIRKEVGCEVILTRTTDVFIPLERRTAIANMHKADLFISLHINAHRDRRISGLETYFLNMATDERAVMVAARENATSEKNISDLQTILNDLMLNTKIHESSRLAHEIQSGMLSSVKVGYRRVRDLGVKQAPFYVLIGAEMPAVLIEAGFLTNRTEYRRLLTNKYRGVVSDGICDGVKSYIRSIEMVYQGG